MRLNLYTIWGGRITGTHSLEIGEAEALLMQQARAVSHDMRGKAENIADLPPMRVRKLPDESIYEFLFEFENGASQRFRLYLPCGNIHRQMAGLGGSLGGASFNKQFKDSLSDMNAEDYAFHSPPLLPEEGIATARRVLAERPAMTTILPRQVVDAHHREQMLRFALHFAAVILE